MMINTANLPYAELTGAIESVGHTIAISHSPKSHAHTGQLNRRAAGLPNLSSLGKDLLLASRAQRLLWPVLPFVTLAAYVWVFEARYYLVLPAIFVAHFLVSVTFTHDVLHGAAGFKPSTNDWWLFAMSLLLLESGHAFRQAHLHHHSHCLEDDDFEGSPAHLSLSGALLAGPLYLPRHWLHAYGLAHSPSQKRWMLAELMAAVLLLLFAILLLKWSAAPLTYCVFVWTGSCLYPVTTAWLPHYKPSAALLGQARSLRGKIIPALLCNLSYHLEHHLYPQVPSYNLPELAERLDPHFSRLGVSVVQVF
ncbi:fatty acid desaturase [Undibacterium sp. TS12]|uniref:fatty acid desaturase family protein n=1 Tax=Undibacterium sp. TS12 TaxID=2908202 RepID=UPI001F4CBD8E|nr:fatty acid desaturase [Undibacterium sp. TS12]MCH8621831.1 fatty acid desaturase [Undibacterium sp. TS12]